MGEHRIFAAQWLLAIAADELFQTPRTDEGNLVSIIRRLLPDTTHLDTLDAEDYPETFKFEFEGPLQFDVYVGPIKVWLDISDNRPGRGGSAVYSGVASFARNSRRVFIGDPDGLSDLALRRRTDAMLSSAIKYGTTDHLAPHQYQREGNSTLGVPPLPWTHGHTLDNIQSMIETGVASLASCVPEICNAIYEFESKTFVDAEGRPLLETVLGGWSDKLARSGEARAGLATLKRNILLRSLVCQTAESRSALLEQALREPHQLLEGSDLFGIFY
ncbi:hypothetical protein HU735_24920 [Pseudomonas sp. BW16M2]|uniref:hypothetical protein n=1 Tax=Pseudomonas sp. BW16M2 TaxID=2745489 RepID=UPI001648D815|nr:hypothetical protein [Pseudomonas sp. BW16M2]MBC3438670.1 hypothetical protein [Pseudomonas sp. BW16M2]